MAGFDRSNRPSWWSGVTTERMAAAAPPANGSRVPKNQYGCTSPCFARQSGQIFPAVPSYYRAALRVPFAAELRCAILCCVRTRHTPEG
jgi:hypothetical protein